MSDPATSFEEAVQANDVGLDDRHAGPGVDQKREQLGAEPPGQAEALAAADPAWLINGKHGVIQLVDVARGAAAPLPNQA